MDTLLYFFMIFVLYLTILNHAGIMQDVKYYQHKFNRYSKHFSIFFYIKTLYIW